MGGGSTHWDTGNTKGAARVGDEESELVGFPVGGWALYLEVRREISAGMEIQKVPVSSGQSSQGPE